MSKLNIKAVETNNLFYNQYRYSARFDLNELGVIRGLNIDKIDQIVRDRNQWRSEHRGLYSGYKQLITDRDVADLKVVGSLLKQHEQDIKFTISYHRGYVYTNSLDVVKKIHELDCIKQFHAQEAVEICPPGTIALKNPKWTHRTYFRSCYLDEAQKKQISNYLFSRENIRLSPGLSHWLKQDSGHHWQNYTQNYFFIDHNNDGELLFLNMVMSNITKRTLQIVAK